MPKKSGYKAPYNKLNFVVAGQPESTPSPKGTLHGLKHALKIGCDGMEIEWVHQVGINPVTADKVREIVDSSALVSSRASSKLPSESNG